MGTTIEMHVSLLCFIVTVEKPYFSSALRILCNVKAWLPVLLKNYNAMVLHWHLVLLEFHQMHEELVRSMS